MGIYLGNQLCAIFEVRDHPVGPPRAIPNQEFLSCSPTVPFTGKPRCTTRDRKPPHTLRSQRECSLSCRVARPCFSSLSSLSESMAQSKPALSTSGQGVACTFLICDATSISPDPVMLTLQMWAVVSVQTCELWSKSSFAFDAQPLVAAMGYGHIGLVLEMVSGGADNRSAR